MDADGRDGVGMRWLVLTLGPGRSTGVQTTLAGMFCLPLTPPLEGRSPAISGGAVQR